MFIQFHSLLRELSKQHQTLSVTTQLHALIAKTHLSNDPFYATRILRFYNIHGDLTSARNLFDESTQKSVFLWNSIIRAYAQTQLFSESFGLFRKMLRSDTRPDNFTYACILRACSENFDLEGLRLVHGGVVVSGLRLDCICSSALVSAYSKVGLVDEASRVFCRIPEPDLVLWNSMISGYGCSGNWDKALQMFTSMRSMGKRPDGYTLVGLISSLVDPNFLEIGQGIHGLCLKDGVDSNAHIGSALVSMYSRCRCMDSACIVFDSLLQPDLVTWSALITGLSQFGDNEKALLFFRRLNMEGGKADPVLIASTLAATAQLAILVPGCEIHGYAIRHGFDSEVIVSSALIDMYSKCGFLDSGVNIFKSMHKKSIVSYNTIIFSLGLYGRASEAFNMFNDVLLVKGIKPDDFTFSALLCACCHAGLVNNGREYFRKMKDDFGIQAKNEHYVYMVKLLGMNGELEEAYKLVKSLPEPVDSGIWGALLSCFNVNGDHEMAETIAWHLFQNKPEKSTYKVMLSNIYAGAGKWDDAKTLRDDIAECNKKIPGISWFGGMNH